MEEAKQSVIESLREELKVLRSQIESMVKKAEHKEQDLTANISDRVGKEFDHYRKLASEQGNHLRDIGEAGLDEASALIRKNPLASLAIAFGAGWVLSCIWRNLR